MVKTVNQLLCGVHIAVAAEAFSLAGKVGVDLAHHARASSAGSAASSWMLKDRGPRMLQADPEVTSAVDIFVKDLGIVLEAGRDVKAALPLAALAHQMFLAVSGQGGGAADDSQVIRAYESLNGGCDNRALTSRLQPQPRAKGERNVTTKTKLSRSPAATCSSPPALSPWPLAAAPAVLRAQSQVRLTLGHGTAPGNPRSVAADRMASATESAARPYRDARRRLVAAWG